ncbi:MAG: flavodoxin family protein [Desulfovibrionaceae bacterium]|nr:flavodoxin family protein [Desulfovibrionaceae bacterium]
MKIIAINGSPNKEGNTHQALAYMSDILKPHGIDTEIVHIGKKAVQGCTACYSCLKRDAKGCIFDDGVNEAAEKIKKAEGIILGSPNYWGGIAGSFKAYLDRLFFSNYGPWLSGKAAGLAVVTRRSGGVGVVHQLTNYLMMSQAVIAPSPYWALAHGMMAGELMKDDEGMQTLREHSHSMAWLIKMINAAKDTVEKPQPEKKVRTNFIR